MTTLGSTKSAAVAQLVRTIANHDMVTTYALFRDSRVPEHGFGIQRRRHRLPLHRFEHLETEGMDFIGIEFDV